MSTYSALTTLANQPAAQRLAEALEAMRPVGAGVFEIEDGSGRYEVGAWFSEPPDDISLALLAAAHGAAEFTVSILPERDWAAHVRRQLTPVIAGRFTVHGGHDSDKVAVNRIGLEIEAATAFGTGHHGTTQGCLLALDRLSRSGLAPRRVADIGCGTGVLAMAAAKLWPAVVWATDIDPTAVAAARANLRANRVTHRGVTGRAAGFRHPRLRAAAPMDLVLANILALPLKRLAPQAARMVAPGGVLVLSGLLTRQAPDLAQLYRHWGFSRQAAIALHGWTTLILRNDGRRSA